MPGFMHEALRDLFLDNPPLAAQLLSERMHVPVPHFTEARTVTADLSQIVPVEFRADGVVLLEHGRPVFAIVLEVQLDERQRRRFVWPAYAGVVFAKYECPVCVLVVAPDARVAAWAREPVELGPGNVFRATVVGPDAVPKVVDPEEAKAFLGVALLSVFTWGHEDGAEAIAQATLAATAGLPPDCRRNGQRCMICWCAGRCRRPCWADWRRRWPSIRTGCARSTSSARRRRGS